MTIEEKITLINQTRERLKALTQFRSNIERSRAKKSKMIEMDSYPTRFWFEAWSCTGRSGGNYEAMLTDRQDLVEILDAMYPMVCAKVAALEAELKNLLSL